MYLFSIVQNNKGYRNQSIAAPQLGYDFSISVLRNCIRMHQNLAVLKFFNQLSSSEEPCAQSEAFLSSA